MPAEGMGCQLPDSVREEFVGLLPVPFPEIHSLWGWMGLQTVAQHSLLALQDSQPSLPNECDLPLKPHQLPRQRRSGPASADNGLIGCR